MKAQMEERVPILRRHPTPPPQSDDPGMDIRGPAAASETQFLGFALLYLFASIVGGVVGAVVTWWVMR